MRLELGTGHTHTRTHTNAELSVKGLNRGSLQEVFIDFRER